MAIMMAASSGPKSPTLVLVPRVTLGMHYMLSLSGSILVHSKMPKKHRREAMEEFKAGNIQTMIATSLADECLAATGWRNDESISTRCGPIDCSLLVRAEQKSLRRFNFRMIFGLHSVSLRLCFVC